ncbi:hypothetical protein JQU17_09010 [Ponticoccus sp. SC2-23]|uniref:hypothetical protein n=1 Tax=Alexandriicola marinus TaxID=2081710 RepID=UPI000FD9554C|nr:hypothetical protein [Alexandriicola marinus]MBM1220175.1 hypothetical protein [Ponticoccus sp. SC6-9]MBM1224861.1 hypothetical protein [Ponticoccus sp. SC6-15]MBM1228375.1 hypothetical protein [Ponticoccus sp. SC6-38]MBM1233988.1 hypothetical protein [Ponticoccus sp. SC6-45]MBM1238876.1 hypothetical protein [Ponticoccus sp. SC6-49]MBM1242658.1 hypothetical protein [Ponticoccus sp. SC2-64]MBM1247512.1 hypothetical protein [Ponticoccus sp. SC6-42]MBM1251829.1 hypothetical protein [Pontico
MKHICAVLCLVASPVVAQQPDPLPQLIEQDAWSQAFGTCAGFYEALMGRGSEAEFGAQAWAQINTAYEDLILASAVAHAADDADMEMGLTAAYQFSAIASGDYIARFESNFAASGEIIAGSTALETDLEICSAMSTMASQIGKN